MVNVSKKYLEENLKRDIWDRFAQELSRIKSGEQARRACEKLFTSSENVMLEKRLAISYLIGRGLTYKEIANLIDVSPATISFIKNEFKRASAGAPRALRRQNSLPRTRLKKFKKRKFPAYTGKGRWSFLSPPPRFS